MKEKIFGFVCRRFCSAKKKEATEEDPKQESVTDLEKTETKEDTKLPKGVVVVTMPRLSDTMTEGTVATWLEKSR
jgi:pyruvate dehydrogenase E2 component (dihydrolipoamide acetyltransferase)